MKKLLFLMLCIGLSGSALAQFHEASQSDDEAEETVRDLTSEQAKQSTEGPRRESSPRSAENKSSQKADKEKRDSAKGDAKRGSGEDIQYTVPKDSSTTSGEFKKPGSLAASLVRIIKRKTGSFAEGVYNGVLFGGAGSLLLYKLKEGAVSSFSTILGYFAFGIWSQRYRDVKDKEKFAFGEKASFTMTQKLGDIMRVGDDKRFLDRGNYIHMRDSLFGGSTSYRLGFVTGLAGTAYIASKAAAKVAAKATAKATVKVAQKAIQAAN